LRLADGLAAGQGLVVIPPRLSSKKKKKQKNRPDREDYAYDDSKPLKERSDHVHQSVGRRKAQTTQAKEAFRRLAGSTTLLGSTAL